MLRQDALKPLALSGFRLPALSPVWAPVGIAILTLAAFWRSFASLVPLLGVENPAGLSPVVPVVVTWLAAAAVRQRMRAGLPVRGPADEGIVDIPVAALLLGISGWLVWQAPAAHGWYYWSYRIDLLAAALFALGTSVLLFGLQTVLYYKGVALATLLIWPEPLIRLQGIIAPPLAVFAASVARPITLLLGANLAPNGGDPRLFIGTGANAFRLLVADVCSASSANVAVPMMTVPAAAHFGISWRKAIPWMLLGFGLMIAGNIARIVSIILTAERAGTDVAMGTVHPVAGAIVLAIVFFILWIVMPGGRAAPAAVRKVVTITPRLAILLVALVGCFSVASFRLGAFQELPAVGPPGGAVSKPVDYFRLPAGWTVEEYGELAVQNLFGRGSEAYWINLRASDGTKVLGQLVTTPHRSRLQAYSLEACRVYHGGDVVGRHTVSLGAGGLATVIDTWAQRGQPNNSRMSLLYWEAPFTSQGKEMHARVALFLPERYESTIAIPTVPGTAPGGAEFDKSDTALLELARAMSREILTASGSAGPAAGTTTPADYPERFATLNGQPVAPATPDQAAVRRALAAQS